MTTTIPTPTTTTGPVDHPGELAAPLDLLLAGSARGVAARMLPNRSWARLAGGLATRPGTLAHRGGALAGELAAVPPGAATGHPAGRVSRPDLVVS